MASERFYNFIVFFFLLVINGGYTHWSEWSECSASCGDGTRMRFRNCTNPKPMRGGSNCDNIGPAKEFEACDLPTCVDCKYLSTCHPFVSLVSYFDKHGQEGAL